MIIWLNGIHGVGTSAVAEELRQLVAGSAVYDPEPVDAGLRELLPKERLARIEELAEGVRELPSWRRLFVETAVALLAEVPGPLIAPVSLPHQEHRDEIFGALASRGVPVRHFLLTAEETILRKRVDQLALVVGEKARNTYQRQLPEYRAAHDWLERDAYLVDTTRRTPRTSARTVADAMARGEGDCAIVQTPEPRGETVAAGVLLFDDEDRVLLVDPTYKPGWEFPGGVVEAGEAPGCGGVREVAEELGLRLDRAPDLLVVDWERPVPPAVGGLRLLFDGGRLGPAEIARLSLPGEELREWRFVSESEAVALLPGPRKERLSWALRARELGRPLYLESGAPTGGLP
ncbi:NUDIX hydrolase [Streptomyces sp. P38-E01]|uniref:NUDIX hydrolase n=1 Tax=Streptomyces tardus TaxID=2780544 RepID=A0A949JK25_9ACTN|nr:NUDIX hydrolase [Streptomyces tardus]MBU7600194.1 NUDIX hydrolase [Streptomyces tardus]